MGRGRAAGNEKLGKYVQARAGGILELRFPVPIDVRAAFLNANGKPQTHIIRSLGTNDPKLANAKAEALKTQLRKEFMQVREQSRSGSLKDFLQRLYDEELAAFAKATEQKRRADFMGDGGWRSLGPSASARITYARALNSNDPLERRAVAGWAVDKYFAQRGLAVSPDAPEYQAAVDECAGALVDAAVAAEELHHGRPLPTPVSSHLQPATREKADLPNALTPEGRLPLSEYFESVYVAAETAARGPQKGERNIPGKRHAVRLFNEIHGDRPVGAITKGDLWTFLDRLCQLPDPRKLSGPLRSLTVPELMEHLDQSNDALPRLSEKTANKHLSGVVSVLKHAEQRRHIDKADCDRVKAKVVDEEPTGRSFTTAELNRIFALPLFVGCAGEEVEAGLFKPGPVLIRDDRFWIPLLLLYTGARSSEAVGLLVKEVESEHEVPHIIIQPNSVRRLKNTHSKRMVPIHPRLIQLGFLDFVRARRGTDGEDARLFPMAVQLHYQDGATGQTFSRALSSSLILRQFNRTHLEHADARMDRGSVKCFRNTFEQESSAKIESDEVRQRLTGRKVQSTARIYTENVPYDPVKRLAQLRRLKADIEKITYDGVDALDRLA